MAIKDFEHSSFEIEKENRSLKYEIELRDNEIGDLKEELSTKDKIISKLKSKSDLTEDMKNTDMLYWVGTMNSIKA